MITLKAFFFLLLLCAAVAIICVSALQFFESQRVVAATRTGAVLQSLAASGLAAAGVGAVLALALLMKNAGAFLA